MFLFSLPTGWEATSFNEERWLNGCGTHGKAVQALHPNKDRNALRDEKGIVLFRVGQNLEHFHHACKVIKGKVYGGVVNSVCDLAE